MITKKSIKYLRKLKKWGQRQLKTDEENIWQVIYKTIIQARSQQKQ